ncbi:hypothetical protein ACWD5R_39400 [Streptomyces sp. NPDC002514]|uniref:hypothetical protein n=1 Tax=unclassified Streptomyces TaxID=2593676 RepID=UPI0036AC349E
MDRSTGTGDDPAAPVTRRPAASSPAGARRPRPAPHGVDHLLTVPFEDAHGGPHHPFAHLRTT